MKSNKFKGSLRSVTFNKFCPVTRNLPTAFLTIEAFGKRCIECQTGVKSDWAQTVQSLYIRTCENCPNWGRELRDIEFRHNASLLKPSVVFEVLSKKRVFRRKEG